MDAAAAPIEGYSGSVRSPRSRKVRMRPPPSVSGRMIDPRILSRRPHLPGAFDRAKEVTNPGRLDAVGRGVTGGAARRLHWFVHPGVLTYSVSCRKDRFSARMEASPEA